MTGGLVLVLSLTMLVSVRAAYCSSTSGLPEQSDIQVASQDSKVHQDHQTPIAATSTRAPRPRPPRGYCVRISRAIKPTSPCHKYLVVASGSTPPVGLDAHYGHQTTRNVIGDASGSHGGNGMTRQHRAKRFAPANWTARTRHLQEELVYVRSETLGDEITNLSTQVINERLVQALLSELTSSGGGGGRGDGEGPAAQDANPMLAEVRKQIAGSSSPQANELLRAKKCRLGVERLVCRLVYPTCHFRSMDAGALVRPPCREDCLLLRDELCPNLNWAKFTSALQHAINSTLMATINALDLLVDGDPPPPIAGVSQSTPAPDTLARAATRLVDENTTDNWRHMSAEIRLTTAAGSRHRRHRASSTWPSGYNLSSSLHFYWPHEHSIDRCELLPPLRPLVHVDAASGLAGLSRDAAMTAVSTKWILDYRRNNAICSNAHLTELSLDEAQKPSANTNTVPGSDRGAAGTTKRGGSSSSSSSTNPECMMTSNGADYKGTRNVTRSGLACQFWRDQYPHRHKSSELLFDIMRDSHNYCRNPGGLDANGPFCYTMNKNVRWEYCQIDRCKTNDQ